MKRSETLACAITVIAAVVLVLLLLWGKLVFDPSTLRQPPRPMAELVEIDEEFIEFFEEPVPPGAPAKAYAPAPVTSQSKAAEAGGTDLADAGEVAPPAPVVVSERPSPVQSVKKDPVQSGPSKKEIEEQEARRKARKGISDAFKPKPEAVDNTNNAKGKDKGDTGAPDGSVSSLNGSGSGSVGGGWIMPRYAKVPTHLTGRIELRAVIDREGKVIKIEQTGGTAPAGADAALVAKCIAEVRSHTFSRTDNDAPPTATARIVYTFR